MLAGTRCCTWRGEGVRGPHYCRATAHTGSTGYWVLMGDRGQAVGQRRGGWASTEAGCPQPGSESGVGWGLWALHLVPRDGPWTAVGRAPGAPGLAHRALFSASRGLFFWGHQLSAVLPVRVAVPPEKTRVGVERSVPSALGRNGGCCLYYGASLPPEGYKGPGSWGPRKMAARSFPCSGGWSSISKGELLKALR